MSSEFLPPPWTPPGAILPSDGVGIGSSFTGATSTRVDALTEAIIKGLFGSVPNSVRQVNESLAHEILERVRTAAAYRRNLGVDDELMKSDRALVSDYLDHEKAHIDPAFHVFLGVTANKIRALSSWMFDILVNSGEQPWSIEPSPVAQVPPEMTRVLVDAFNQQQAYVQTPEDAIQLADRLSSEVDDAAFRLAKATSRRIESQIRDMMHNAGFNKALEDFIADISMYPNAFFYGPVPVVQTKLDWPQGLNVTAAVERESLGYAIERISPYDVFPSQNATSPQNGDFIAVRRRFSRSQLLDMISLFGFDEVAIRAALTEGPNLDTVASNSTLLTQPTDFICYVYYGRLPNSLLIEHGLEAADPQNETEVEAWVVGNHLIRVIPNYRPMNFRPVVTAPFMSRPGSFWGVSLPAILRDVQRSINLTFRSLMKNSHDIVRPVIEYDKGRLPAGFSMEEDGIFGRYVPVTADFTAKAHTMAIRVSNMPSHIAELRMLLDDLKAEADVLSGIPAFALGSPQVGGGAGRTLGGLQTLLTNASKGVKRVVASVDTAIEQLVLSQYRDIQAYGGQRSLLADLRPIARGSRGILQRELNRENALDALRLLSQFAGAVDPATQQPMVPPSSVSKLLREVMRSMGFDPDEMLPQANGLTLGPSAAVSSREGSPPPGR